MLALVSVPVGAIGEEQKLAIVDHCDAIKVNLKDVQKRDARTRVYLGGRYETILTELMKPLNVSLVEQDLSNAKFVENQNSFAEAKAVFASDYVSYQQRLEELVGMDCKNDPEGFYTKLKKVREKRKTVSQDVVKMRKLISDHVRYVKEIMEKV